MNLEEFYYEEAKKYRFLYNNLLSKIHEVMEDGRTLNVVADVLKSLLEDKQK